ncbi:MAG: twin-arginine translocase TatA/TatE family subunit, partial [Coriobacteriales bacterium]|nr:twin-arginine translocase TatA/TatE family subunit [Coriobacteriales bacterium]
MFGLSGWEIAIIALFGFMIFGPDRLPQIARTVGRAIRQFRSAQEQMNQVIKAEVYDPIKDL